MSNTTLPPELVEKYRETFNMSTKQNIEKAAQIAVEYSDEWKMKYDIQIAVAQEIRKQRDELLEAMREFTNAIESEEITIQENCDNDGWENCGGRLYETFKQLINKIDGK
jgi:hypothetical protein